MFEQIEMWPAQDYNRIGDPELEPPEPDDSDSDYDDGYDYEDDGVPPDDFDFEMPVNDEETQ